nr:hypothetical protein [Clostridium sporogenes]
MKFNLQEKQYPYFEDKELEFLLEINNNDVEKSSYKGCILKAIADDGIEVAGVKLQSNRAYWLTLAEYFKEEQKILKDQTPVERVDEH